MSAVAMGLPATTVRHRAVLHAVPTDPSTSYPLVARSQGTCPKGPRRSAFRLTQRGRLVRTLLVFGAVSLVMSLALARVFGPGAPVADHATTVRPGQTLTEIARVELPELPATDAIARLRELNGLSGTAIVAGQSLLIPAG